MLLIICITYITSAWPCYLSEAHVIGLACISENTVCIMEMQVVTENVVESFIKLYKQTCISKL